MTRSSLVNERIRSLESHLLKVYVASASPVASVMSDFKNYRIADTVLHHGVQGIFKISACMRRISLTSRLRGCC